MSEERQIAPVASAADSRMSFEEFLQWANEDTHAEWVDGEVVEVSPASAAHQELVHLLDSALGFHVARHRLGTVFPAPFVMRLGEGRSGREPDVLFVASEHADRIRPLFLDGPADLVVEVVSASSRAQDTGRKLTEYEASGVREYWIIDPDRQRAEFHVLSSAGLLERVVDGHHARFESRVLPGVWLDLAWLWQVPLPSVTDVLAAWGLIS